MNQFTATKPKEDFRIEVLEIKRVTRVTSGGKRFRFKAIIIIGDGKGSVSLGVGKAGDVSKAIEKAKKQAKKRLMKISLFEGRTIPFEVRKKYKSSSILLKPAPKGKGIIAGGTARIVCRLVGIQDITAKSQGSANKLNKAKATLLALKSFAK